MAPLQTKHLTLLPRTVEEVRAQINAMAAEHRSQLSPDWLARLNKPDADLWTLGFTMTDRVTGEAVGQCGFKSPPTVDGVVEIAYLVEPGQQGKGFATAAAGALTAFALSSGRVRIVRAHTLPEHNASTRVLQKNGFRHLGEVIDPEDGPVWRWEKQNDGR